MKRRAALGALICGAMLITSCDRGSARMETRWRALEGVPEGEGAVPGFTMESSHPASIRVEDVDVAADVRRAFVARGSLTLRFKTQAFRGAALEVALAPKPVEGGLTWVARGGPTGQPASLRELGRGSIAPPADGAPRWTVARVSLGDAEGPFDIEITAESPSGRVALAEPAVLGPTKDMSAKPNVLVYVIDCLRADRVGAFGSTRNLTPAIDALARESVVLEQAWSCASWTKPSVACMLTGQLPPRHGARTAADSIAESAPRLAEAFARAGYQTRALVANPVLDRKAFGYGRGFRSYRNLARDYVEKAVNAVPADAADITKDLAAWTPGVADRPFFAYVHSLDLHYPYESRAIPGRPAPGPGASESDLYDSEIAYNDLEFGKVVDGLRARGLLDNTILVVTADHGEEFGEHGANRHGHTLYQSLVHVPMLIRLPKGERAGTRVTQPVSNIDLGPTLLALAGLPPLSGADGVSLAAALRGQGAPRPMPLFAEQISNSETLYAARDERYKAIETLAPEITSLAFDLSTDPEEKAPLTTLNARAAGVRRDLLEFMSRSQEGVHLVVDTNDDAAPVRVEIASPKGFTRVYLMGRRTGEPLTVSNDGRSATYEFKRSGFAHHLVAVPADPDAPMTMSLRVAGRPVTTADLQTGEAVRFSGPGLSFRARDLGASKGPATKGIRLWYQEGAAARSPSSLDPKLQEELKALGYIK